MTCYTRWNLERIGKKLALVVLFPVFAVLAPITWALHEVFVFWNWLNY